MLDRVSLTALFLFAASITASADVIVTRDGERIEGLIVGADLQSLLVQWGAGRAVITRRVWRREIETIRFSPPDLNGLRDLARRSALRGETADACSVYGIICGLHPESVDDQVSLSQNLRSCGRLHEALAVAQTAEKVDPRHSGVHFELGEIHLALGDASQAVRHALGTDPESLEAQWLLGRAYERAAMFDEAIRAYRCALRIDPTHAGALERVTQLYQAAQAPNEAETVARAFIRAAPEARAGRVALGIALYRQARFGEAVDAFRAATSLGGTGYDRARIFLHCARARSANTDPSSGLTQAESAVAAQLDPDLRRKRP
ncbi:MAG: tetratricopeptide repeat protein [Planctomycetes bacterium]|nr:tetratricopeptide repeat protein [Planctomycetota bacterium]